MSLHLATAVVDTATDPFQVLVVALFSGSLVGAVVAWRKAGPEKDKLLISAAEGVVGVQQTLIDDLREELRDSRNEREECERRCKRLEESVSSLKSEVVVLERELRKLARSSPDH